MSLNVRTDRTLLRATAASTRYVLVEFTAPAAPRRAERAPVNVAFVLDRSGSMSSDDKFPLARRAIEEALRLLRSTDRFSLVVYDDRIDVLVPGTFASPDAKQLALRALQEIGPRGSTNLCEGWLRGCEQIAMQLAEEQIGRCLLLTDGLANQGITDHDEIVRHTGELRRRGVTTTTLGVGSDFDERLLRDMAQEGGGNAYYVQRPEQIADLLTSELGEALETVMRSAAIHVALPRGARAEPLNSLRWSHIPGDNELRVELGNLVSEQEISAVVRIAFPHGPIGERTSARVSVSDAGNPLGGTGVELWWTYGSHAENDAQPRDVEVDVQVATLYAARARAEATEANRRGDFVRARRVLDQTAERILSYANGDARLIRIAQELREDGWRFEKPMTPSLLKQAYYMADWAGKSRREEGRARRRGEP